MAKEKKIKVVHDYFGDKTSRIIDAKQSEVISNVTKWELEKDKKYICLRKCITHTENIIFEIVHDTGEIITYGSIYFE